MWGTKKTSTKLQKTRLKQVAMPKGNRIILHETKTETRKVLLVIEITLHQGQVKTARTKPNDQQIEHCNK